MEYKVQLKVHRQTTIIIRCLNLLSRNSVRKLMEFRLQHKIKRPTITIIAKRPNFLSHNSVRKQMQISQKLKTLCLSNLLPQIMPMLLRLQHLSLTQLELHPSNHNLKIKVRRILFSNR